MKTSLYHQPFPAQSNPQPHAGYWEENWLCPGQTQHRSAILDVFSVSCSENNLFPVGLCVTSAIPFFFLLKWMILVCLIFLFYYGHSMSLIMFVVLLCTFAVVTSLLWLAAPGTGRAEGTGHCMYTAVGAGFLLYSLSLEVLKLIWFFEGIVLLLFMEIPTVAVRSFECYMLICLVS